MSRTYADYSDQERAMLAQQRASSQRVWIGELEDEKRILELKISCLMEAIHKLPEKQSKLTIKRAERIINKILKEDEVSE